MVKFEKKIEHAFDSGLMPYKKVRLFNNDCEMFFRSMSVASDYIGRSRGYISNQKQKGKTIKGNDGKIYEIELL